MKKLALVFAASVACVWGCSGSGDFNVGSPGDEDTGAEAGAEAGGDAESGADSLPDSGLDYGLDSGIDSVAPPDSGPVPDAPDAPDAPVDTGPPCTHSNGVGQTYSSCAPLGVPGSESTYTSTMAQAARVAYVDAIGGKGSISGATCLGLAAYAVFEETTGKCTVWAFHGTLSGHVHVSVSGCVCPTASDATWN